MNYYRSDDYGKGGQTTVRGLHPHADQFIKVRQTPCTSFQAPRFRLWTAVQRRIDCCLSFVDFVLYPALE